MGSSQEWYPFDGKCERSKDADFTLRFDNKACLKVPRWLLVMASPVMKTAIEECQHDGSLHLPKTSTDTWLLILNYIHPVGRSVFLADSVIGAVWKSMVSFSKTRTFL